MERFPHHVSSCDDLLTACRPVSGVQKELQLVFAESFLKNGKGGVETCAQQSSNPMTLYGCAFVAQPVGVPPHTNTPVGF